MALVSKTLSGFWNGVSQQAPTARRENQVEFQENAIGTIVDGLIKRPNTEFLSELTSNASNGAFIHRINRDVNQRYIIIITGDATEPVEIFNIDGTKCTVQYGAYDISNTFVVDNNRKLYFTYVIDSAIKSFKAVTIADHTIVVNTTVTTGIDTTTTVPGTVTGIVQSYPDLPATPTQGDLYAISGDPYQEFTYYYMTFDNGVWREYILPGSYYRLNDWSLPYRIVRTGTNTFNIGSCIWDDLTVGDNGSVQMPSFINKRISNVFFYKNRLGFLSEDNVIMSRTGSYFDFFPASMLDIHDDDPIDTSASAKDIQFLRSVAVFDKSLILLADQQQFDLNSDGGPLAPKTVTITPTTAFPIDSNCDPVSAGANVYFVSPKKKYTSIREYYIQPDSLTTDAADVTAHVPQYILNGEMTMEVVNSMDMLFVHSDTTPSTLFVYKYFWNGDEKPQSAWGRWTFEGDILGFKAIDSTLYIIFSHPNDTAIGLYKIELENVQTGDLSFRVHLDRMVELTGEYNSNLNLTTFTLPYTANATEVDDFILVDQTSGLPINKYDLVTATNKIRVTGDYDAQTMYVGKRYEMRVGLSEWFVKNSKGMAVTEGRLQVRSLSLTFTRSGTFKVEILPYGRSVPVIRKYSGVILGTAGIGVASLRDDTVKFLVMSNSKNLKLTIVNDSYMPTAFQTGMLEGWYHSRSRIL